MKGIDPKWVMYLGLLVTIEQAIGHGTVSLTNLVPADWAPYITSWCNFLAFVGTSIMTYQAAVSSPASGPLVNTPISPTSTVVRVLIAAFALSLFLASGSAMAQMPRSRPAAAPAHEAGGDASPAGETTTSYQVGKLQLLRLPNPLKLPDPLCLTDHPGGNCPENTAKGGGVNLSGDPGKDLADFLKRGGIVLVRDMKRADQYLSAPSVPSCTSNCTKVELTGSSCLEALIPVAEMVVNGPQPPTPTPSASPTPTASASPSPSPSPSWPPTVAGKDGTLLSTLSPPVGTDDEGVITQLAKQAIVLDALNSPTLSQGCGGFIVDKVKSAQSLAAGIMSFITTLGVVGAPVGL